MKRMIARVGAGGLIQVKAPELLEGQTVEVTIEPARSRPKKSVMEILSRCPGERLFQTAEEVDEFIRNERDSWER